MKTIKLNANLTILNIIYLIFNLSNDFVKPTMASCRQQEIKECESMCYNGTCEIRVVVIVPDSMALEASSIKVRPVLELAENRIYEDQLLPDDLKFKWIMYDDKCDASYSTIISMDAYGKDCAHFIMGPTCDYALAAVSRIIKYFRNDGMPLITPAGNSYDYVKSKVTCDDEYFMLIRTGILSFKAITDFSIALMKYYEWTHAVYIYERNGYYNVGGLHTCHLLMSSLANYFREEKILYNTFVTDSTVTNMTENLKREVGIDHAILIHNQFNCENVFNNQNSSISISNTKKYHLKFGVLLPGSIPVLHGKKLTPLIMAVIEYAVDNVKYDPTSILSVFNIEIDFQYNDTQCSSVHGLLAAHEIYLKLKPDAFFGPVCDYVLAPIARSASLWQIPILTPGGLAEAFTYKQNQYETLTRMMGSYRDVGKAVHGILAEFGWNIVGLAYHNYNERAGKGNSDCYFTLSAIFRALNNTKLQNKNFDESSVTYTELKNILTEFKQNARIIIMCGNPSTIREIMLAADELNMVDSGEYVFINMELFSSMSNSTIIPWFNKSDTDENNLKAKNAYTALLTVTVKQPDDLEYQQFSDKVKSLAVSKYNYTFEDDEKVSTFVTAFYDSVLLYTYALNDTINELGRDILEKSINGSEIVKRMWNRNFTGITGDVIINSNGDRVSDYSLLDMNPETGEFEIVANYFHDKGLKYVEGKNIHWSGGRTEPPPDKPTCGFDNSLCPDNSLPGYAILSIVLGFVVILMAVVSILGYRHYKLEAEINSMTWRVNWDDVLPCNPNSKHRNSIHSFAKRGSQITIQSEDGSLGGDKQLYIPIGFYKGNKVAIKPIDVTSINMNRDLMLQLKKMKDLQHEHLVRFYGACVDLPHSCFLTEYCPKGSLQDILENEQIKLDMMFKLSLMHDIVRGMHYLHSTDLTSHGSLKSSNCVVDSRFVLKITDFGLHELRKQNGEQYEDDGSYAYWKKMLWTAPEILRMDNPPPKGTPKGDIYSFGIVINEIITRQGTFYLGDDEKSPKEIIQLVKEIPKNSLYPFRPKIDDTCYDDINSMMIRCWCEEPTERPDFGALKSIIRKINKENESGNILDNLLKRMEMYANNLEFLVEERTQDYLEEKRKCEELLYQLLPKSVTAQLIMGKSVVAETYDQVTIYFSDIVGFTTISAESTPMQVVDLLNDLYTCFDSIVENFDVYKVETIGDAYMVVSGLPVRNGNLHAREIARLALALLNAVYSFQIRHRPNEQLKLRIGLHSGPCVAGVVGLKMPRYCLFGDTVNTASRMESNGLALKIHMSESTKQLLDKFGTFIVTERGLVEMKGKGSQRTFWLDGEIKAEPNEQKMISILKNNLEEAESITQPLNGTVKNILLQNKENKKVNNTSIYNFNNLKLHNNQSKIKTGQQQYKKIANFEEENLKNSNLTSLLVKK